MGRYETDGENRGIDFSVYAISQYSMYLQTITLAYRNESFRSERREHNVAIIGAILDDIAGSQYKFSSPTDLDWINVNYLRIAAVSRMMRL